MNPLYWFAISANTSVTATFTASPTLVPSRPSQPGSAGSSCTFQFNVSGFSSEPTLTASCSIPALSCGVSGTTLTVTTTARPWSAVVASSTGGASRDPRFASSRSTAIARRQLASLTLTFVLAAGIFLAFTTRRARRILKVAAPVGGLAQLAAYGGSGSGTKPAAGTPLGTYPVTVTATSGAQIATTTVSVMVQ